VERTSAAVREVAVSSFTAAVPSVKWGVNHRAYPFAGIFDGCGRFPTR
jgi:hypothetical protein